MKIIPVTNMYTLRNSKLNYAKMSCRHEQPTEDKTVSFKGFKGLMAGGATGMTLSGIIALSALTPVGWAAAVTYLGAIIAGTVAGAKIGDMLTGEDSEDY